MRVKEQALKVFATHVASQFLLLLEKADVVDEFLSLRYLTN